jgi:hypothetical protein
METGILHLTGGRLVGTVVDNMTKDVSRCEIAFLDDRVSISVKTIWPRQEPRIDILKKVNATEQPQAIAIPANDLTWTDPATGLTWAKQDNGADITWNDAVTYCSKLRLGSYSNWRLGTINELDGIHDDTKSAVGCCRIKGDIKLSSAGVWSGSAGAHPGEAWIFEFLAGSGRYSYDFAGSVTNRALCVRPSKE